MIGCRECRQRNLEIVEAYRQGVPVLEIVERFGTSTGHVSKLVRRAKVPRRGQGRKDRIDLRFEWRRIGAAVKAGTMTVVEAARELGCTRGTVYNALRRRS